MSGVASQGYMWEMFVFKYKVYYSTDGKDWKAYKEPGANVTKVKKNFEFKGCPSLTYINLY